jgi:hypothetical protein
MLRILAAIFMTIKQNKGQTILLAVITLIAFIGLFCVAILDIRKLPHDYNFILDNAGLYWILRLLCFPCCFITAVADIYLFKQIFSKKPLILICDEYFYDNSSALSFGKIAWSEMERVYIKGGFLNIKLKNPEPYIRKKNRLQILMIKGNYKLGYGDVCISPERFKKDAAIFIEEFRKRIAIEQ